MARRSVLIIDDDAGTRVPLRRFLEHKSFEVFEADGYAQTMALLQTTRPDGVVLESVLSDGDALQLMEQLKAMDPDLPVLVLTAIGSIDLAVRAIQEGADHFLTRPVELSALWVVVERMLTNSRSRQKELAVQTRRGRTRVNPFIGTSPAIQRLESQVRRALATDRPVLIQGETGTGKGELARWTHENSTRGDETFVELNCAGLSRDYLETELFGHEKGAFIGAVAAKKGLLEAAHHGTILLDEIADVDSAVQPKLLKVLKDLRFRRMGEVRDRIVDVRLIAATHQNLQALVERGAFRPDLYFRISALPLIVSPLRERTEDIPLLAQSLLGRLAIELGRPEARLTPAALDRLCSAAWPGNIRELRNVLERAVLLGDSDELTADNL